MGNVENVGNDGNVENVGNAENVGNGGNDQSIFLQSSSKEFS